VLTRPYHTRARFWQLADGLLFALAVALAYTLRAEFPLVDLPELEEFSDYVWLLLLSGITGPVVLAQQGFYQPAVLHSRGTTIFIIMRSCAYAVLAMVLFLFIVRVQFARSVIILGGTFAAVLIYARHELSRTFADSTVVLAEMRRRALWAGTPAAIARLQAVLAPAERELLITAATLDPRPPGAVAELAPLLHTHAVNIVLLSLDGLDAPTAATVLAACDQEGVEVMIHPGLPAVSPARLSVDQLGDEPILYYHARRVQPGALITKQVLDYVGAASLLVLLAPLFLLIALMVRLSSPGPVLYRQPRAGLNGHTFTLYKFRSMSADAEARQAGLADRNEMTGPVFKITDDPRITRVGRLLRRHSLDELPQLWNVLRGEMSLVGPRPLPVAEVHRFDNPAHRRRLSVKPGLTCLWQIRGRNEISSFEEWVRLDLEYIDQWSLWLDAKILFATIPVTLFGRGGR
jgi:exopolysaccharide biosynthesis polyprenyl glycosylphosphotransferase